MQQVANTALLITIKDVMRELNLGRSKIEALIKREGLPVVKFGRAVRVNKRSLEYWLAEREHNQKNV